MVVDPGESGVKGGNRVGREPSPAVTEENLGAMRPGHDATAIIPIGNHASRVAKGKTNVARVETNAARVATNVAKGESSVAKVAINAARVETSGGSLVNPQSVRRRNGVGRNSGQLLCGGQTQGVETTGLP